MKLTHITTKENKESILKDGIFKIAHYPDHFKPDGVWLSIDGGWEEWCKNNDFAQQNTSTIVVELKNQEKYIVIDSLDDFKKHYNAFCDACGIEDREHSTRSIMMAMPFYKWIKEQGHHGIILTEKGQWSTRMFTFLYGWDCASICVFEPSDIIIGEIKC